MEWKGTRGMRWVFPQNFSVGHDISDVEECVVGNLNGTQLGCVLRIFVGNFGMNPD